MMISRKEAAQRYGITPQRMLKALESGRVPGMKILGRWLVDTDKTDSIFNYNESTDNGASV